MGALLTVVPPERWVSTGEVAELARAERLPVVGNLIGGRELDKALRRLNREGWLIRRPGSGGFEWTRTPTGDRAVRG